LFGSLGTYTGKYKNCPPLDEIIKASGQTFLKATTNEIEIDGTENPTDVKLAFPFPFCAPEKD
jgi:hypothetical protein